MKVQDLIDQLSSLDPQLEVRFEATIETGHGSLSQIFEQDCEIELNEQYDHPINPDNNDGVDTVSEGRCLVISISGDEDYNE